MADSIPSMWAIRREVPMADTRARRLLLLQDLRGDLAATVLELSGPVTGGKELLFDPVPVARRELERVASGEDMTLLCGDLLKVSIAYVSAYVLVGEFSVGRCDRVRLATEARLILEGKGQPPCKGRETRDRILGEWLAEEKRKLLGWVPECELPRGERRMEIVFNDPFADDGSDQPRPAPPRHELPAVEEEDDGWCDVEHGDFWGD